MTRWTCLARILTGYVGASTRDLFRRHPDPDADAEGAPEEFESTYDLWVAYLDGEDVPIDDI